ncbi:MAG: hypothetical protein RIE52_12735 [Balneola sp.]|jgi:hypothetical protein
MKNKAKERSCMELINSSNKDGSLMIQILFFLSCCKNFFACLEKYNPIRPGIAKKVMLRTKPAAESYVIPDENIIERALIAPLIENMKIMLKRQLIIRNIIPKTFFNSSPASALKKEVHF